jgi:hypothetical protein
MASFRIIGVHTETRTNVDYTVEAMTQANARAIAEMQGVAVSSVWEYEGYVPGQATGYYRPGYAAAPQSVSGITAPLLVSAISNIVVGLIWLSTCFGAVLTVPMIILCVYEFALYSKASQMHPMEFARQARNLGIFEIIVGMANLPTLICGIIVMIQAGKIGR